MLHHPRQEIGYKEIIEKMLFPIWIVRECRSTYDISSNSTFKKGKVQCQQLILPLLCSCNKFSFIVRFFTYSWYIILKLDQSASFHFLILRNYNDTFGILYRPPSSPTEVYHSSAWPRPPDSVWCQARHFRCGQTTRFVRKVNSLFLF